MSSINLVWKKWFSKKGGRNCDVLLMSATPIPRTMMMSLYGDISKITEKPATKKILTLSKPENKWTLALY